MKDRAEAFILQTKSGQWMVEVWSAGEPVQCVAGLEFVITQDKERPSQ